MLNVLLDSWQFCVNTLNRPELLNLILFFFKLFSQILNLIFQLWDLLVLVILLVFPLLIIWTINIQIAYSHWQHLDLWSTLQIWNLSLFILDVLF